LLVGLDRPADQQKVLDFRNPAVTVAVEADAEKADHLRFRFFAGFAFQKDVSDEGPAAVNPPGGLAPPSYVTDSHPNHTRMLGRG